MKRSTRGAFQTAAEESRRKTETTERSWKVGLSSCYVTWRPGNPTPQESSWLGKFRRLQYGDRKWVVCPVVFQHVRAVLEREGGGGHRLQETNSCTNAGYSLHITPGDQLGIMGYGDTICGRPLPPASLIIPPHPPGGTAVARWAKAPLSSRLSSLCFTPLRPKFNPRTG